MGCLTTSGSGISLDAITREIRCVRWISHVILDVCLSSVENALALMSAHNLDVECMFAIVPNENRNSERKRHDIRDALFQLAKF